MNERAIRNLRRSQVEEAITERIIGRNAERNRAVVARKLFGGVTFEQLADEFGLSVRQVKTIVYRGYDTIFRHIHSKN